MKTLLSNLLLATAILFSTSILAASGPTQTDSGVPELGLRQVKVGKTTIFWEYDEVSGKISNSKWKKTLKKFANQKPPKAATIEFHEEYIMRHGAKVVIGLRITKVY